MLPVIAVRFEYGNPTKLNLAALTFVPGQTFAAKQQKLIGHLEELCSIGTDQHLRLHIYPYSLDKAMYLRARSTAVEQEEQCMPMTDTCRWVIAVITL